MRALFPMAPGGEETRSFCARASQLPTAHTGGHGGFAAALLSPIYGEFQLLF